jgi:hypothetical protein
MALADCQNQDSTDTCLRGTVIVAGTTELLERAIYCVVGEFGMLVTLFGGAGLLGIEELKKRFPELQMWLSHLTNEYHGSLLVTICEAMEWNSR